MHMRSSCRYKDKIEVQRTKKQGKTEQSKKKRKEVNAVSAQPYTDNKLESRKNTATETVDIKINVCSVCCFLCVCVLFDMFRLKQDVGERIKEAQRN